MSSVPTTQMFRSRRPSTERPKQSAEEWEDAAPTGGTVLVAKQPAPKVKTKPWEGLDPTDEPNRGFHVRVNAYEFAMLEYIAKHLEDKSKQRVCRRVLREFAEARLELRTKEVQDHTGTE